ncbi:substrate-binding periplasmic protein [Azospirillum melinis]|nr:ABC transporter substrate-binding protein [Azospirillum melinis]MBP2304307.1 ABC-type amino acid transport substrate-binding protein [Azospirillum melinis]
MATRGFWAVSFSILSVLSVGIVAPTMAADGRLQKIAEQKQLRVCSWPDYYAISFRNPRTGALEGLDAELAQEFVKDLGVRLTVVESSFPRFIEDLLADRCDIGMFAIGATPARAQHVTFSQPYLRSGIYAVTTQTNSGIQRWEDLDRTGNVVVVQKDTYMDGYARSAMKAARIVAVTRPQEREEEVQSGRADAFLTDYPYGQRMLAFHPWARLIVPDVPVQPTPYAYAVAPGDAAWLDRVNAFVAAIKADGRLESIAARYKLTPIVARD